MPYYHLIVPLESIHNKGKGILINVTFQPQLGPLGPGKKRRANAKAKLVNGYFYLHENADLGWFLTDAFKTVGYKEHSWKIVRQDLRTANKFIVHWSVVRTDFKNIVLDNTNSFSDMIHESTKKMASPAVKLHIETIVRQSSNFMNSY